MHVMQNVTKECLEKIARWHVIVKEETVARFPDNAANQGVSADFTDSLVVKVNVLRDFLPYDALSNFMYTSQNF